VEIGKFKISWVLIVFIILIGYVLIPDSEQVVDLNKPIGVEHIPSDVGDNIGIVARIKVSGPIFSQKVPLSGYRGPVTYADEFVRKLRALAEDELVKGIVVEFNTPGGTTTGSLLISEAIREARTQKPVYGFVTDLSASGGVWSMVAAKKVYAQPGSLVGSIGVLGTTLFQYDQLRSIGNLLAGSVEAKEITGRVMYMGEGKPFGSPFYKPTEEDIKKYRALRRCVISKRKNSKSWGHASSVPNRQLRSDSSTARCTGGISRMWSARIRIWSISACSLSISPAQNAIRR